MMMRAHGQTTAWETYIGVGRARAGDGWRQQLRRSWSARRDAHRRAKIAALNSYWDSQREAFRLLRADAAPELAAAQGTLSIATMLYSFTY
jgi:hypothetical protein